MPCPVKLHSLVGKQNTKSSTPTMAAAAACTTAHHHLKLVIDPDARQVLFAEASGEAIEFLHSLVVSPDVSLPFHASTRNACIANVHDLVDNLRSIEAAANFSRPPPSTVQQPLKEEERFFVCGSSRNGSGANSCGLYVTDKSGVRCPSCRGEMAAEVPRGCPGASCSNATNTRAADGPAGGKKGPADLTCMLMDDLDVVPASNVTTISYAPGTLQETVVCLGHAEAMEILETSLLSSNVLTNVFLCNKKACCFEKSHE